MRIKGWIILQAEAMKFVGTKGDGVNPNHFKVYSSKEDARDWLKDLIAKIKHEQSIGWRTENNLNPKESLDFLIQEIGVEIPLGGMKKRGWNLENIPNENN